MRWIFFHGVFGDWGWEQVDDAGGVIAESRGCFESRDDAEGDAAHHGYRTPDVHAVARWSGATSNISSAIAARSLCMVRIAVSSSMRPAYD